MNNADNSMELSSDEVNNRLDELYAELKTLKPYLPFHEGEQFSLIPVNKAILLGEIFV